MNIGVIGAGAVGMLIAAKFSQQGHEVTCYVKRESQYKLINDYGIIYNGTSVKVKAAMFPNITSHDLIIVATKQHNIDEVIEQLCLLSNKTILFVQNGMGHIEKVKKIPSQVYIGTCDHGVERKSDYTILHHGQGEINFSVGGVNALEEKDNVLSRLNSEQFPISHEPNLERILYRKLVVNCVVNPLTAIFHVKNGAILVPEMKGIAYKLTEEACMVLHMNLDEMWDEVLRVCRNTSENISSMLSDIMNGNPTEIDHMNGYLIDHNPDHVLLPSHEWVVKMVHAKEKLKGEYMLS
ncbi:2-dehydropantoate 2-reductase [Halalkalibacillus halophilus]|uniref:2-dehydropantoate 2-reductase n=1 Tax=Halalkalibacillus halophilus TaxID=392827 RepID=UPI0004202A90|nr:2-dehydropantoate 2-reductase [Halalkalibacillus halophilus]